MKISVVTPTKDRPEMLPLVRQWFEEQTTPVHEHLVIDGGSHLENLRRGALEVDPSTDVILWADDDDHYRPDYTEWVTWAFSNSPAVAVGQLCSEMHHIRTERWRQFEPVGPLPGLMAFRLEIRDAVLERMAREDTPKLLFRDGAQGPTLTTEVQYVTHIKGLYPLGPGQGLSVKHHGTPARYPMVDSDLESLSRKIGRRAVESYLEAIEKIDERLAAT